MNFALVESNEALTEKLPVLTTKFSHVPGVVKLLKPFPPEESCADGASTAKSIL